MKGFKLNISGNWAQFRRAETNNNPLSHDFITKTALIGMIGAVLGKNRAEMKDLFPVLCEDIKYGVKINNDVVKQSWGFTFRSVFNSWDKAPKQMEFIKNMNCDIVLCLVNERSQILFDEFESFCKEGKSCYEPILGLHNCPAEIHYIGSGNVEYFNDGKFETQGFVTNKHVPEGNSTISTRMGFDKIPTFQNNDFWNLPEKYISVIYPTNGHSITVRGFYYSFCNEKWCLI